jgi:arsenate reductase
MRIIVLCTGNSCRSQMAEGLIRSFGRDKEVYSAGTDPADHVHPKAISVMNEIGIDISYHRPKTVDIFLNDSFDYVLTVCDDARENCPVFTADVKHRIHIGFPDPAKATGTEEEIMNVFREVRDKIYKEMRLFVKKM